MVSSSSNDTNGSDTAIAIVSVITGGVVVLGVAFLMYKCIKQCIKRKHNKLLLNRDQSDSDSETNPVIVSTTTSLGFSQVEMQSMDRFLSYVLKDRPVRFTSHHLRAFTLNFSEKIGSGGFGVVYKGHLPNGVPIAVKILNSNLDRRAEQQFMAEVGTIGRTYHMYLVRLYGFCFEATVKALVYEYMENGSLEQHLFNTEKNIEFDKLHEIAVGTAKGIRYLHEECEHRIIHYDIKPGNVLLTASFSPKVADFGLAKLCDRENTHLTITGARGTPGYAAPELWMPLPVTHKCDVYSFGMLLFEIIGRRRNFDLGLQIESQEWYPKWVWQKYELGQIDSVLSLSGIEENYREKAERMCKIALWCVQHQPDGRPTMGSVVRMLEGEEEIEGPVNPFAYLAPYDIGSNKNTIGTTNSSISGASSTYQISSLR